MELLGQRTTDIYIGFVPLENINNVLEQDFLISFCASFLVPFLTHPQLRSMQQPSPLLTIC